MYAKLFSLLLINILLVISLLTSSSLHADPLTLASEQAILIDPTTDTVLYEKNADVKMPPSSMTKIMTAYMVFEALKAKQITMDTQYTVSEKAWRKGGTKMFLPINASVSLSDLLRGVIVQSGNDASIVLAEGLMGTEQAFAEQMTKRAHEMGASHTNFVNATGWPDNGHESTVRDLTLIGIRTIIDFPQYYDLYKELKFAYNNIAQMNRNPLLYVDMGCDGLKTGHTDAGGYGLVASAVQDQRRLILTINGAKSMKQRAEDAKALMAWGFSYFATPKLFRAGQVIETIDTWLGNETKVAVCIDRDVAVTLPRQHIRNIKVELVYHTPLAAPLHQGQVVGKMIISAPEKSPLEIPLKTMTTITKANFFDRIKPTVNYLIKGHH